MDYKQIVDPLPFAVYIVDTEGRLTYYNRQAVSFSGRTPELGTDRGCISWKLLWPDGSPMPYDESPMADALKEGRRLQRIQAIAERPDGSRIWFEGYPDS